MTLLIEGRNISKRLESDCLLLLASTYSLLLTFQVRKIKVCYRGELKHWEKHNRPHCERGLTLFGLLI